MNKNMILSVLFYIITTSMVFGDPLQIITFSERISFNSLTGELQFLLADGNWLLEYRTGVDNNQRMLSPLVLVHGERVVGYSLSDTDKVPHDSFDRGNPMVSEIITVDNIGRIFLHEIKRVSAGSLRPDFWRMDYDSKVRLLVGNLDDLQPGEKVIENSFTVFNSKSKDPISRKVVGSLPYHIAVSYLTIGKNNEISLVTLNSLRREGSTEETMSGQFDNTYIRSSLGRLEISEESTVFVSPTYSARTGENQNALFVIDKKKKRLFEVDFRSLANGQMSPVLMPIGGEIQEIDGKVQVLGVLPLKESFQLKGKGSTFFRFGNHFDQETKTQDLSISGNHLYLLGPNNQIMVKYLGNLVAKTLDVFQRDFEVGKGPFEMIHPIGNLGEIRRVGELFQVPVPGVPCLRLKVNSK